MRLIILFIFVFTLTISAKSYSQKVNLSEKDVPLEKVLRQIREQVSCSVLWGEQALKGLPPVSVSLRDASLEQAIKASLEGLPLAYTIHGDVVYIERKPPALLPVTSQPISLLPLHDITGTVADSVTGEPLAGVTVLVKGGEKGTTTDADGKFTIAVENSNVVLVVSYLGYNAKEVAVAGRSNIQVSLSTKLTGLDQLVVVGYGTQKKKDVTGSISTVDGKELTVAPIASVANMLAGRLPGLISLQSSGQPGYDAADLSIRGFGNALVIVDGVETDFNSLDPNEIESISILKDGAASIYGSRAGNGVILITTKRGKVGKPTITLNSSYTLQGITAMPKPVNAGQYAEMAREEWINSGQPEANAPFTEEQIQKYYEGNDPLYPNTNWYDVLVRDWAPQQQYNLSVRGGSEKVKYYGFLGYLKQETMWKKGGGGYERYNFQSNVDADILDNLSFHLTLSSIVGQRRFPERPESAGTGGLWSDFWVTLPIYPSSLPDPTKIPFAGGGGVGGVNVTSNRSINGYNNTDRQDLNGALSLDYSFKAIKGLSARAFINYSKYYSYNRRFLKPVSFYTYDPASGIYTLAGSYGTKAQLNLAKSNGTTLTEQFSLTYNKTFSKYHHINFLALYEVIDYSTDRVEAGRLDFLTPSIDQVFGGSTASMSNNGWQTQMGRKSYVGRLDYDYKDKYLLSGIFRADASAKFPPEKRWGYFPSLSLGWRLSQENFMQGVSNLDELKMRLSYGQSGRDAVGNYQYLAGYNISTGAGSSAIYGSDGPVTGLVSKGLANPNLTWEKVSIYNAGVDFSWYNGKLYGTVDAFYRTLDGIPVTRISTLPSSFGAALPPENLNSQNSRGFEFELGTRGRFGDLQWDVKGNISWSRAKWDHYEEPAYSDSDQIRINKKSGRWTDRQIGYLTDGLFTSQEQIDKLPYDMTGNGNGDLAPGDLILKDLNDDGKVDWRDQVVIGKGTVPHWMVGVNLNLKYKNFDFSALFQGAMGYYTYILYQHGTKLYPEIMYELRWTPEHNDPHTLVPRLGGASTNLTGSDYYYKKAGYLRLKAAALGYNLPERWLHAVKVSHARIYVAGTNLLTFDKLKVYDLDPEAPSANGGFYYPQQRTISFGVNISF